MELNKLISEKLHPLFIEHGFELIEESKNIVRYELGNLFVALVHNTRENFNTLWVGRGNFQEIEIDNQVMKEFFNSDLKLSYLPLKAFVSNVFLFFLGDGEGVLKGNETDVISLEKFNEKRSVEYTENLKEKQSLEAANKAWKEGNYSDVIKYLKMVNEESLSASFKQKYKIARQRLSN